MHHIDIWATNVMITAHEENLARAFRDSQRRGVVSQGIGSLLIRLGERLRRDVDVPRPTGLTRRPRRYQAA